MLSLVVRALIYTWGLLETADRGIRHYLLTNNDQYLTHAAMAYPMRVEVDPLNGATVTI